VTGDVTPVPLDLALRTPEGEATTVSALLGQRLLVVQLVRYFGCLPCQEWLTALDRAAPRLAERDVAVTAVGGSADYQARWLHDERGVTMPLYLDPDQRFRDAVGASKRLGVRLLDPRGAAAYTRSLRHGFRPQGITSDTVRSPGVVILDRFGNVCWRYVGTRIGDYPPLDVVEEAAVRLSTMTK
jgi:peroxiredoxin